MHMIQRHFRKLVPTIALACGVAASQPVIAADPDISVQPMGGEASYGESFGFSVTPTGTAPFSFQWRRNGSALNDQTNSWLTITNLSDGNAGVYSVVVTNMLGTIVSSNALLSVTNVAPRAFLNGTVTGGSNVTVPIFLSANGREHRVIFTMGFDPAVLTNPTFQTSVTNDNAMLDTSLASAGLVTGDLTLPPGQSFPGAQQTEIGQLHFDFLSGTNPLAAGLYFTNASLAATNVALDTNDLQMVIEGIILPQATVLGATPTLNPQSGLFEHQLVVSYPGAIPLTDVTLLISGSGNTSTTNLLGFDSRTNAITVYNSPGQILVGPHADGQFVSTPYVSAGSFQAGESRTLTIEYYVSDHTTAPNPAYSLSSAASLPFSVPSAATPLNITTNRFVNGTYIIQWPSRMNYQYFIQYAPTLDDLIHSTTNSRVVFPAVQGTGYAVQWIDNGPPKTESPPASGSRFYRVLELPTK